MEHNLIMEKQAIGRVTSESKEIYTVKSGIFEYKAKVTGKQIFKASSREDFPAVGDLVEIKILDEGQALIQKILPRKTVLRKKYNGKEDTQIIGTNIDAAFIVESVDRDFSLNRLERYIVLLNEGNIQPIIILNKIDLISPEELKDKIAQINRRFKDIEVISTSIIYDNGIKVIEETIKKDQTYCFLGSSGVGKSSLINKLLKKSTIKTTEISDYSGRGKHTTTSRQMYFLSNNGVVIDNPGMREIGLTESNSAITNVFNDIESLSKKCKFTDCTHIHEPGCAILEALKGKKLDEDKYQNYLKLKKESNFYALTAIDKRQKDRKFGKFIKKALEELDN